MFCQFLERDPNKRLGYRPGGGGFADIKGHPWFSGIDWDALYNKAVVPPFEPDVSDLEVIIYSGRRPANGNE